MGTTCLKSTSLRQTTYLEPLYVQIGSRVWPVHVARNKNKTKKMKKARDPYMLPTSGGATADLISTILCAAGRTALMPHLKSNDS